MTCLPAWLRAAPASCSRRPSSCPFTATALRVRGASVLSLSMRRIMPVLPRAATAAPISTCPISSKPWATRSLWLRRPPQRLRLWPSSPAYYRLPARWSTRRCARTCSSRMTEILRAARTAWCQSWRRGKRPSSTSIRATSPWRSPRRCASVCPIAQPISRSITRGLRVLIAVAWRKHSETEASAASSRHLPLARASTCPISAMSCSITCRLAALSLTR